MCRGKRTTGAKAQLITEGLRGPEGPLFHGDACIPAFFRNLFSEAAKQKQKLL
jgi:hypothetical protein